MGGREFTFDVAAFASVHAISKGDLKWTIENFKTLTAACRPKVVRTLLAANFEDGVSGIPIPMTALVPNLRGLERALAAGTPDLSIWVTGSEGFSAVNVNMTIGEHRRLNREIARRAAEVECEQQCVLTCYS